MVHLLADIASGETDTADIVFLIAAILGAIGFAITVMVRPLVLSADLFLTAAVALIALGLLVL